MWASPVTALVGFCFLCRYQNNADLYEMTVLGRVTCCLRRYRNLIYITGRRAWPSHLLSAQVPELDQVRGPACCGSSNLLFAQVPERTSTWSGARVGRVTCCLRRQLLIECRCIRRRSVSCTRITASVAFVENWGQPDFRSLRATC